MMGFLRLLAVIAMFVIIMGSLGLVYFLNQDATFSLLEREKAPPVESQ